MTAKGKKICLLDASWSIARENKKETTKTKQKIQLIFFKKSYESRSKSLFDF